jgi:protein-S-isoprenylcysteine O-methyltransferase Ste14
LIGKDLIKERSGFQKGAKKWDIIPALLVGRIGPLLILIISGLDVRFDWSGQIPLYVRVIALIIIITGLLFSDWAVITNRIFSGVVRIQHDRGHVVISTGPYAYVRHPGYSGSILWGVGTPLFLGSPWALSATIFFCIVIIFRTALEDATLQRELNGYKDYTRQVHYRLFPGIW